MTNKLFELGYRILKAKLNKKPCKLNFTVTSFCNSRCLTCNIWRNPPTKKEMDITEIEKLFKKLPDTVCWLSLTGGEPFSRNDFSQIIKAAINNIPNLALIGIPTNGLYQSRILDTAREIMAIKKHPRVIITCSIDGPEQVHNYIRGVQNGFKITWDTYTKLKELLKNDKDFIVGIETTISNKNLDTVHLFLERMIGEKHFISVTFAHEAHLYKNTISDPQNSIIPKDIHKIKKITQLVNKKFRFWHPQDIIEKKYLNEIQTYLENRDQKVVPCMSLITTISLDSFGTITPCLMWGKNLGNVQNNDYDIMKIYDSTLSEETRNDIAQNKCPNCWTPCEAYQSILWDKLYLKITGLRK